MNKDIIIRRVADILKETPSAEDIVKKGGNRDKRFLYLARYMVNKAIIKDALITAGDGLGIAILFESRNEKEGFLKEWIQEIGLVFNVTGIKNAFKIVRNQKYIKNQRPQGENYLYAWFWGIAKNDRGAHTHIASQMKDEFLRISEEKRLPLYAETRLRTNAVVYQRYKFENFHTWKQPNGSTMWFLRYIPESLKKERKKA